MAMHSLTPQLVSKQCQLTTSPVFEARFPHPAPKGGFLNRAVGAGFQISRSYIGCAGSSLYLNLSLSRILYFKR
ncbi:hypothetical protein BDZ91DRAFT_723942 [Kalaharituber pfeilii]|nr:hypothetical protein BDZ91DRAFT_723942 [Kalaharituber pfeilii]